LDRARSDDGARTREPVRRRPITSAADADHGLLESLRLNQSRGVAASRLFETGRMFVTMDGQALECAAVGFLIAEPVGERAWLKREPADFYLAKHHITAIAAAAGIDLSRQPIVAASPAGGRRASRQPSTTAITNGPRGSACWTSPM